MVVARALLVGLGLAVFAWPSIAVADDEAEPEPSQTVAAEPDPCGGKIRWEPTRVSLSLSPKLSWPKRCHPFGGFLALALPHASFRGHDGVMLGGYTRNAGFGIGLQLAAVAQVEDYAGVQIGLATLSGEPNGSQRLSDDSVSGAQLGVLYARAYEVLGAQIGGIGARSEWHVGATLGGVYVHSGWSVGLAAASVVTRTEEMYGLELGGLVALSDQVKGIQLGGVLAQSASVIGIQLSAGFAASVDRTHRTWPEFDGLQVGGLGTYSVAQRGVQVTGLLARAGELRGMQIAGFGAISGRSSGLQLAGAFTLEHDTWYADYPLLQGQFSSLFNVAGQGYRGLQVTGMTNFAGAMIGAQLATINVTHEDHRGVQLGGVHNYAGSMHGVQVGLINVTRKLRGAQVGLLNFSREGGARFMPLLNIGRAQVDTGPLSSNRNRRSERVRKVAAVDDHVRG